MKIIAVFFFLVGFALYFLNSPFVLAKNNPRDHRFLAVATASPAEDIDAKEKDLGRGEPRSPLDLNQPDIDLKEKDLGRGELLSESAPLPQDIDSNEKDLGQGEPFIQSDTFGTGPARERAGSEILVGEDFTDAVKGKNFTDQSLLNAITLRNNPSVNDDEINFKNNARLFEPETLFPPKVDEPVVIDPASSTALPEVVFPE